MNFRTGGQTGVDRAVLDECLRRDLAVGGWCPDKRIAEDGRIADRYPLQALEEAGYPERTEANVRDSDATLVLHFGSITGGTKFTLECCQKLKKPSMSLNLIEGDFESSVGNVIDFLNLNRVRELNVAGPRSSEESEAYAKTITFLQFLLPLLQRRR